MRALVCPLLALAAFAYAEPASAQGAHTSTTTLLPEEGGPLPRAEMPEGGLPSWRDDDAEESPHEDAKPRRPHADVPPLLPPDLPIGPPRIILSWRGYIRVLAEVVENDALLFIGRNDGFKLANARLELGAAYGKDLRGLVSIDAALAEAHDLNDPNAELAVGLRDGWLEYDLADRATVRLGRFKSPYDIGELEPTSGRVFIEPPLESRGVQRTHGLETAGMSQDRQLGVMLHKKRVGLTEDGFDLGYAVALTNGKTDERALNDNDLPAGFLRVSFHYAKAVSLHLGGFVDKRTAGELPNLLDDEVLGAEASIEVRFSGLSLEAQLLFQRTEPVTAGTESFNAIGGHAQWAYRIWNLEPAYRFAYYEPNDAADRDVVTEHTLGISYYPQELPLRLSLNGTFSGEERKVNNNRIGLLVQLDF